MKPPISMSHPKPIVPRTLVALFSSCLGFIVLYAAFTTVLHMQSTYSGQDSALSEKNAAILRYISGPVGADNNLLFLSPSEWSHMSDVKHLFDVAYIIYLCCVGVVLGIGAVFLFNKWWDRFDELLGRSLRAAGWTLLALCFVTAAASLLNFDKFWLLFHAVFFPQGNWMFPSDSMLITLYPPEFFSRFVIRFSAMVVSFSVSAVLLSVMMERMRHADRAFTERFERKAQKPHKHKKH